MPGRAPEGAEGGPARLCRLAGQRGGGPARLRRRAGQRGVGQRPEATARRCTSRQDERCVGGSGGWASMAPPAGGVASCLGERQGERRVGQHGSAGWGRRFVPGRAPEGAEGGPARLRRRAGQRGVGQRPEATARRCTSRLGERWVGGSGGWASTAPPAGGVASCLGERQRERRVGQHGYAGWQVSGGVGQHGYAGGQVSGGVGQHGYAGWQVSGGWASTAVPAGRSAGGGPARLRRRAGQRGVGQHGCAGWQVSGGWASTVVPAGEGAGVGEQRVEGRLALATASALGRGSFATTSVSPARPPPPGFVDSTSVWPSQWCSMLL